MSRPYRPLVLTLAFLAALPGRAALGQQVPHDDPAAAQVAARQSAADGAYLAFVKEAGPMPEAYDFGKLRTLYARTSFHDPAAEPAVRQAMAGALAKAAADPARLKAALALLDRHAANVPLYVYFLSTAEKAGIKDLDERYHKWMLAGLYEAMMKSGDGERPESAFKVLGPAEEYFIVRTKMRHEVLEHTVFPYKGRTYDVFTVRNPRNAEEGHIYFSTDMAGPRAGQDGTTGKTGRQ